MNEAISPGALSTLFTDAALTTAGGRHPSAMRRYGSFSPDEMGADIS